MYLFDAPIVRRELANTAVAEAWDRIRDTPSAVDYFGTSSAYSTCDGGRARPQVLAAKVRCLAPEIQETCPDLRGEELAAGWIHVVIPCRQ